MMQSLCKHLVISALCFSNTWAIASDWIVVSTDNSKNTVYVDKSSIALKGKYTKAWLLWNFDTPQKLEDQYPSKTYYSTKALRYFDCTEGTQGLIQIAFYQYQAGEGENLQSIVYDLKNVTYQDFIPDTMSEALQKFVCNNSRNKLTKQRP